MNTNEFLTISAAIVPDRPAVIFEGRRTTFQALDARANRLADALAKAGVKRGDRVAVYQVNTDQVIEAYFAAMRLDAIFLPLNFRAKREELAFMLNDAEPAALFVGGRYVDMVKEMLPQLKARPHIVVALDGCVEGWAQYGQFLAEGSDEPLHTPSADDEDTAVLMFTAGTTGTPKGVMLSHQSFSSYILSSVAPADPEGEEERNILSVPLYHVAGLQAMLAAVYGGRTIIVMRQFEPEDWMALVAEEKASRAMMVPTMLKQLMEHPKFREYDLSSLQVITYGASPMPLPVIKRALGEFPGVRFINAFGQTESASTITMLPPEDHDLSGPPELVEKKLRRLGSIGKPLEDVEVRIVDEEGREVPPETVGEIAARGPRIMKGYWKREEATKQTIRGGWLFTGDLGLRDADGYIYLAGRAKDFIKRGGEMIAPEEVEQCLMSHPAVDEAAIIGVPDEEWSERVRAIVVLKPGQKVTEPELIEYCRKRLASFKKPESVVFVDELPRNPMGKVLKRVLREQFSQPIK